MSEEADPENPSKPDEAGKLQRRSWLPFGRNRRKIPTQVKWTVSIFILFFVLEYFVLPEIASVGKNLRLLGHVNIAWLLLALLLEAGALIAYAELTYTVLSPHAPSRFRLFRINMSSLAISHVVPGGTAPGTALAYRLLGESRVAGSTAGVGLATQGVGSAVVLNAIFWLSLLISIPLTGYNPLYGFAAIAGLLLLAFFGAIVLLITRGRQSAVERIHAVATRLPFINPDVVSALVQRLADRLEILLADRALLFHAMIWAAFNWLLDAGSLYVFLLAFHKVLSPIDLLVAYGLANVLAVIPITPGGLGVIEGVLIPTLIGFGAKGPVATLSVIGWRLVNFWLPIPLGGLCYLSLRVGPLARIGKAPYKPYEGPGEALVT